MAGQLPVLIGHLERHFHSGGAIIGIENAGQTTWRYINQLLSEADGRFVAQAEKGGMGDFIQLLSDGLVERGMIVTPDVDPKRRVSVQKPPSFIVAQPNALGRLDNDRLALRPLRLLSEGVPEIFFVPS